MRGIEWSLRAFASMRARAVISFVMRAASTLKIINDEQRALRKFPNSWNLSLLKRCFVPSNHLQNRHKDSNMISPYCGSTIPSSLQPIMHCLICHLLQNYFTQLHESQWVDAKEDLKLSKALFTSKQVPLKRVKTELRPVSFNKRQ